MCVCVMGYRHKNSTAQQRQGHHSLLLPDCQVGGNHLICVLVTKFRSSARTVSYVLLTADPLIQHQQIFVEQYFQTKG